MYYTSQQIGKLVRDTRKAMGVTQSALALTSGTGQRFISDLEKGKPTCQLNKVLIVLHTLGIKINFSFPVDIAAFSGNSSDSGSGEG